MLEGRIYYSSVGLFAMGCLTLALFIVFRLKFNALKDLPKNLSANVFNKTFAVFDPYSERKKIIHRLLTWLPLVAMFATVGFALLMLVIIESGLLLTFTILFMALGLLLMEEAPEAYQYSNTFIKAVQDGASLGVGDLKLFQMTRKILPKLSNYYLCLSILFITLSVTLQYFWTAILWSFAQYIALTLQASTAAGILGYQLAILLFALTTLFIQVSASKIKGKFLRYATE